jgi:hypothetical protein
MLPELGTLRMAGSNAGPARWLATKLASQGMLWQADRLSCTVTTTNGANFPTLMVLVGCVCCCTHSSVNETTGDGDCIQHPSQGR